MNKKLITALVAVAAVLALSFCLAACGDDGTQPGGGEGGNTAHKISIVAPDDVEASTSASQATVGTKVTVTVVTPAWKIATFVTATGVEVARDDAASAGSTSVYTFTMPDRDVELNVETTDSGASVDEDDGLKWVAAPKQIAPGENSFQKATYEVDFGEAILASMDGDGNLSGVKISSTDQDVIPDEAIAGAYRIGDSVYTDGATFTVDLTKVSLGATTLVFEDSRGRTIAKYVQVVEYGKVDPGYIFNTSMFVDFAFKEGDLKLGADVDPDKLLVLVSINDVDWVDGTDPALGAKELTQSRFLLSDSGTKSMGLSYIQGHRYRVTASLWTYTNDPETDMDLSQVTGSKLVLHDNFPGGGNSVKKDEDGTSWLTIVGYSGTVTLKIYAE
ncbi:MAG TPA: hypothetical protein IAB15_06050 [Candidatus Ornithoclostridium faecigallinarum]|nr:hypothetical protein [Candidatus Ornithoclostridium faecigallinarum]